MRKYVLPVVVVLAMQTATATADTEKPVAPQPVVRHHVHKPVKKVPVTPRTLAQRASRALGFKGKEWRCLHLLWMKESHFNPKARNKKSGAYGIAQFMPQTWKNYKVKMTSDPNVQVKLGLRYITNRYGRPCNAWDHSKKHGWY